jgi:GTPase
MTLVDELMIKARAGRGGDGVERWLHLKGKEFSGPSGGDGGNGGDVVIEAVRDLNILSKYTNKKKFSAENGESGRKNSQEGRRGRDVVIKIPIGSVVTNLDTKESLQLLSEGEKIVILKGGRGGMGNKRFKGPTNTRPKETTPGKPGEEAAFLIELEMIADAGFVGLPNAGKSTLLNFLTGAKSKIGSYEFTTLEPFLGNFYGYILADIPGLIEGASDGKGLGHKFLRHVKRTRIILHCISVEADDLETAYRTIRKELESYGEDLIKKEEIVVLTKTDMLTPEETKKKERIIKKHNPKVLTVSVLDDVSLKRFSNDLSKILDGDKAL